MSESDRRFETLALHSGQAADPATGARAVPIYQTTSYLFEDSKHAARFFALEEFGNIYSRIMNPTCNALEARIAALEGGSAGLAVSSRQAAITLAVTNIARQGQNIASSSILYGGTYNLFHYTFAKFGIDVRFVDPTDSAQFRDAIDENTRALYAEAVGNPKSDTLDIEAVAEIAHAAGIPLIIDNTMPTPYSIRSFEHGADVVVHSATKFIGGHGPP